MTQPAPSSVSVVRRVFNPALAGAALDLDVEPGLPPEPAPVAKVQPPPVKVEAPFDRELIAVLRANLRAATRHAALGHEGPSFRECSRPSCRDATKLVPAPEGIHLGATDAELDLALDRVLAALEQRLPEVPPARTARGVAAYSAPIPR